MTWIFPIIFLILFEVVADILSKEYSLKGYWYLWVLALLGYVVANVFWLWSIRTGSGLARGAVIFSVGSAVLAVLIGLNFYGEEVSKLQITGIALGIVSLILILK